MTSMTHTQVIAAIRKAARELGSQAALAREAGITKQHVSLALQGVTPCEALLRAVGIERVVRVEWRRVKQ